MEVQRADGRGAIAGCLGIGHVAAGGVERSTILHGERLRDGSTREEAGVAVHPHVAARQGAEEEEAAAPYVGGACVAERAVGELQQTVALFHQTGIARDVALVAVGTQLHGVIAVADVAVVVVTRHHRTGVDGDNLGADTAGGDAHARGIADEHVLAVVRRGNAAATADLRAATSRQGWGSNGDVLHLTEVVAHVGRLVVSHHLPHHRLAVLVVEPQAGHAVGRVEASAIDTQARAATHDNLLAPVADDVALETGVVLRVVVHVTARRGKESACARLLNLRLLCRSGTVQNLRAEVAIPVDAEVELAPGDEGVARQGVDGGVRP